MYYLEVLAAKQEYDRLFCAMAVSLRTHFFATKPYRMPQINKEAVLGLLKIRVRCWFLQVSYSGSLNLCAYMQLSTSGEKDNPKRVSS